jgi:YbbR domain-containing protein
MPFQDIEDTASQPLPRPPSPLERSVRKIFLEDWNLKLLALGIAVVLWMAVTGQNQPVTMRVSGVQLNFVKQEGLDISNDVPSTIEVILTGSPSKLDQIGRGLVATVDVSDQKAGERVVRLSTERVKMVLPDGVKIQSFQPATIPLRLEPTVEAQVPVEVKFEGKVADGFEVVAVRANPSTVRLRGPSDRLSLVRQASTETVWLEGKKESFTAPRIAINIADPKIDILDPNVDVLVEIAEAKRGDVHLGSGYAESWHLIASILILGFGH